MDGFGNPTRRLSCQSRSGCHRKMREGRFNSAQVGPPRGVAEPMSLGSSRLDKAHDHRKSPSGLAFLSRFFTAESAGVAADAFFTHMPEFH